MPESSGSRARTSTELSPELQEMQRFYLGTLRGLEGEGGGLGQYARSAPEQLWRLGPQEQQFQQGISQLAAYPPGITGSMGAFQGLYDTTQQAGGFAQGLQERAGQSPVRGLDLLTAQALASYLPQGGGIPGWDPGSAMPGPIFIPGGSPDSTAMATWTRLLQNAGDPRALGNVRSLAESSMRGPTALERQGLSTLEGRTDPTAQLQAAQDYMRLIGEPQARAASVAGGMGGIRGGAFQEGLAQQSAALALPIWQQIQQARGELGGAQLATGAGGEARKLAMNQALEAMFGGQVERQAGLGSLLEGASSGAQQRALQGAQIGAQYDLGRGQLGLGVGNLLSQYALGRGGQGLQAAQGLFGLSSDLESRGAARRGQALQGLGTAGQLGATASGLGAPLDAARLQMLMAGAQGASLPRLLEQQEYARRQDLMSQLLGIPIFPSGVTTSRGASWSANPGILSLL